MADERQLVHRNALENDQAIENALYARRLEVCAAAAEVLVQSIQGRGQDVIMGITPFVIDGNAMQRFGDSVEEMLEVLSSGRDAAVETAALSYELATLEIEIDLEKLEDLSDDSSASV